MVELTPGGGSGPDSDRQSISWTSCRRSLAAGASARLSDAPMHSSNTHASCLLLAVFVYPATKIPMPIELHTLVYMVSTC